MNFTTLISFWHRAGPVAERSRAEPSRAEPSRAEPSRAGPSRATPSRAEPGQAEPSRAGPSRPLAEPSRAGPGREFACAAKKYTPSLSPTFFLKNHGFGWPVFVIMWVRTGPQGQFVYLRPNASFEPFCDATINQTPSYIYIYILFVCLDGVVWGVIYQLSATPGVLFLLLCICFVIFIICCVSFIMYVLFYLLSLFFFI